MFLIGCCVLPYSPDVADVYAFTLGAVFYDVYNLSAVSGVDEISYSYNFIYSSVFDAFVDFCMFI